MPHRAVRSRRLIASDDQNTPVTRRRKFLPVIAGVGALVVLTVLALSWREIAVQYHLRRLRRDPEYVSEVIEQPEGTVVRDALHQAIATPDGAETFCRAIVLEVVGWLRLMNEWDAIVVNQFSQRIHRTDLLESERPENLALDTNQASSFAAFLELLTEVENATCWIEEIGRVRLVVNPAGTAEILILVDETNDSPEEG